MNFKKFTLATIITVLAAFAFSSCSSDRDHYRWIEGYLKSEATFYTGGTGNLKNGFSIDDRNIYSDYGRIGSIHDLEFVGYGEVQLDIWSNALIDELWLDIDGTNVELYYRDLVGSNDDKHPDVDYFMDIVVDQIRRYGYANINVEAKSRYRDVQIDVRVFGDVNAYVRD